MPVQIIKKYRYLLLTSHKICITASCMLLAFSGLAPAVHAQSGSDKTPPSAAKLAPALITTKPEWHDLTPSQQQSLKPLAASWNTLDEAHKRKWIAIAGNYPSLNPADQVKLHSRMTEWVSLSQQQRAQARLNFAHTKQLAPAQKAATWEAYQALRPEEKQKLAQSAPPKPTGAATATKPVPPQKLAKVPVTRQTQKEVPPLPPANNSLNRNTLLPRLAPTNANPASEKKSSK